MVMTIMTGYMRLGFSADTPMEASRPSDPGHCPRSSTETTDRVARTLLHAQVRKYWCRRRPDRLKPFERGKETPDRSLQTSTGENTEYFLAWRGIRVRKPKMKSAPHKDEASWRQSVLHAHENEESGSGGGGTPRRWGRHDPLNDPTQFPKTRARRGGDGGAPPSCTAPAN